MTQPKSSQRIFPPAKRSLAVEDVARLPWRMTVWPWIWVAVAAANIAVWAITGHGDPAITVGALVMSKLSAMENAAWQRGVAFSWQGDWIVRRLKDRP